MPDVISSAEELRPLVHAEVDRLPATDLAVLHRVAMQLELERLTGELDAAFDQDRLEGRLAQLPEIIQAARQALSTRTSA